MVNIFIANLDWEITTEDIMSTFSSFGTVSYANVVYDKDTKKSKGFAYVEMESSDEAINAIEALNGLEINGRAIDVKIASPKGNRPQKKEQKKFAPKGQGFGQKRTGDNRPRQGGGGGFSGNRNNFNRNNNNSNRSGSGSGSGTGSGWSGEKRDFSKNDKKND